MSVLTLNVLTETTCHQLTHNSNSLMWKISQIKLNIWLRNMWKLFMKLGTLHVKWPSTKPWTLAMLSFDLHCSRFQWKAWTEVKTLSCPEELDKNTKHYFDCYTPTFPLIIEDWAVKVSIVHTRHILHDDVQHVIAWFQSQIHLILGLCPLYDTLFFTIHKNLLKMTMDNLDLNIVLKGTYGFQCRPTPTLS